MKSFYQSCYLFISRKRAMVLKLALCVLLVLFYSIPSVSAYQPMQDVVYLKNGSIIHGQIIEQIPNVSIKIQTRDGNIFVYEMEEVLKIVKEPIPEIPGIPKKAAKEEKSPGLAFALSFLMPGVGQHYNGQYVKGVIQNVLYVGGWILVLAAGEGWVEGEHYWVEGYWVEQGYWDGYDWIDTSYWVDGYDDHYEVWGFTSWFYIGLGISVATALWSMIDAPLSAAKINKKVSQQRLSFDVTPKKQGMEAKLTLRF